MDDYTRHYATLQVTDEADWKTVRARYRRLIGQWHPDRFASDAPERGLAEERSKQITIAYQALERYHRKHGVLPPVEPAKSPARPDAPAAEGEGVVAARGGRDGEPAPSSPRKGVSARRGPRAVIVASALLLATYATLRYVDRQVVETDSPKEEAGVAELPAAEPPAKELSNGSGGITAGSTLGDVYAIQGIPSTAQGDTWYYGKSAIRFSQGKVVSWTEHPDNPLRIARNQPVELHEGSFSIGSTKDEVRAVQGTPVSETETVWDYGPSRVFFENNRVVGWNVNPLQPLHVPR
jgi:DnaJ-like protein